MGKFDTRFITGASVYGQALSSATRPGTFQVLPIVLLIITYYFIFLFE